ncbi:MAG: hypothetical protein KC680_03245 [Candidatus Peregrinibacteria bacterium]|nr:hypothetical protein [Candidatus Peregrinibacteria bacterium]MCB9807765.1 hypothetical protein [Candidatus Peribacteria bacterium]
MREAIAELQMENDAKQVWLGYYKKHMPRLLGPLHSSMVLASLAKLEDEERKCLQALDIFSHGQEVATITDEETLKAILDIQHILHSVRDHQMTCIGNVLLEP